MLTGLRQGLGALGRVGHWARRAPVAPAVAHDSKAADGALKEMLRAGRKSINEIDAKTILRHLGVSTVEDHVVTTAAQAVQAAGTIGFPVVLKAVSDDIPHRSEHGLVAVGLRSADEVTRVFAEQDRQLVTLGFDPATISRVVQPVAPKGVEVIVGIGSDPEFGVYIAFGAGGVLVELIADAVVRPLPLRSGEALDMVRSSKVFRLLDGYRGAPPSDVEALVSCIERVAAFAFANRTAVREIDLNPIFVGPHGKGCTIADALIIAA
jgi:acyl-CoA synthetase (NDP forming)